jgi:hypothetical protein
VFLAALLAGVPIAAYFYGRYFAVPATVVLEGVGVLKGLKRSAELSRGFKRKVLGTLGVPLCLLLIMQLVMQAVTGALPGPAIIGFIVDQAVSVIAYPIISIIATLLYYDARIRKEAFDIVVMAAELGAAAPPAAAITPGTTS